MDLRDFRQILITPINTLLHVQPTEVVITAFRQQLRLFISSINDLYTIVMNTFLTISYINKDTPCTCFHHYIFHV